jgi:hypothetical protein
MIKEERKERDRVINQVWTTGLINASRIAEDAFITIVTKDTLNNMDLESYRLAIREIAEKALEEMQEVKNLRTQLILRDEKDLEKILTKRKEN